MSKYEYTPIDNKQLKQANNAQFDSKLIRLKTNLSFISLIDWTAIILFVGLCVTHCVPAYAVTLDNVTGYRKRQPLVFEHYKKGKNNVAQNETLVLVKAIVNQAIAENETLMKQLNETVSFKNHLTNGNVGGYHKALSKQVSGKPNREPLAFFVSKNCAISQIDKLTDTNISFLQGKTLISKISNLSINYEGVTLQNKKAFWRICRVVAYLTKSEPPHPIFNNSVNLTQNKVGDI